MGSLKFKEKIMVSLRIKDRDGIMGSLRVKERIMGILEIRDRDMGMDMVRGKDKDKDRDHVMMYPLFTLALPI